MALVTAALLLPLILLVCAFGPGFVLIRRCRWPGLDTVVASVGVSLILVYAAAFLGFVLGLGPWFNFIVTIACGAALVASWRDVQVLWRQPRVRALVWALLGLQVWMVGTLLLIRHYSGGDSCCDWVEHYQRTTHFIEPRPDDFLFIDRYLLTARPPLQNVVAAHVLSQTGISFAAYQVVFALTSALMFLPVALMARLSARRGFSRFGLLAIVCAANPMFFVNTTYPWTKALTVFFVVLGLWCYLRGWRKPGRFYLPVAFLFLGAGILVHYSAVPYALALGLHYLFVLWRRQPRRVGAVLAVVGLPALLLLTWFGWSLGTFGVEGTFLANSTAEGFGPRGWREDLLTIAGNVVDTLRPSLFDSSPGQTALRVVTDRSFMLYQVNLFFGIGSIASLVAVGLLGRGFRTPWPAALGTKVAVASFLVWIIVAGVGVHGARQTTGLAFIALQPLIYTVVALVVGQMAILPVWVRRLFLVGLTIDFVAGVVLQVFMQSQMATWARTPNWDWKRDHGLVYLGDLVYSAAPVVEGLLLVAALAATGAIVRAWWPPVVERSGVVGPAVRSDD